MFGFSNILSPILSIGIFFFPIIVVTTTFAQSNGCEPVATIPHGATQIHSDATRGVSLSGQTLAVEHDGKLMLYRFLNQGQPILQGEATLPVSGVKTQLSYDNDSVSVAYRSSVSVAGPVHTTPPKLRTVDRFSLLDATPISSIFDERENNITPQSECAQVWGGTVCGDVYHPNHPWETWSSNLSSSLGRFFVSSEGVGALLNNREFTENYFEQNFPACLSGFASNLANCIFSEGAMLAGGVKVLDDVVDSLPTEKWTLPPVPELIAELKELHPCTGSPFLGNYHCMSEADFDFSYFTDLAVDHDTSFAIVGMKVGVQPDHIADMEDIGMVSLMKLGANSMTHAAESAVTAPIAGQKIGFSVAAVGSAEVVDETGTLIPAFVVASGAPGNGHPSASLPANACTSLSAASVPPTRGGAVFLSAHAASSGRLEETTTFYRQEEDHQFGYDVAAATDLNGDSQPEVIAGAPGGSYAMIFSRYDEDLNGAVTIEGSSAGFGKQVGVVLSQNGARFFAIASDTEIQIYDAQSCYQPENFGNGGLVNDWQPSMPSGCPGGGPQTEEEVQSAFDQVYDAGVSYLQSLGIGAGFEGGILNLLQPLLDLLIDRIEEQLQEFLQSGYNVSFMSQESLEQFIFLQTLLPELQDEQVRLQKAEKRFNKSKKLKKKARDLRKAGKRTKAKKVRKRAKKRKKKAEELANQAANRLRTLLEPTQ